LVGARSDSAQKKWRTAKFFRTKKSGACEKLGQDMKWFTLLVTNIFIFEDDSPFPKVGYVCSLDGRFSIFWGRSVYFVGGRRSFVGVEGISHFSPGDLVFFCGSEELSFVMGFLRAPNL